MTTVISVENLSKFYHLGSIGSGTIMHDLQHWWARWRGRPDPLHKIGQEQRDNGSTEAIWALREINFEVKEGEVLGIIGRNGAGKSTLLKILSRVTAPTTGQVKVRGRIASLLEVGTGFHPDLTGRENIYLNGAILGMHRLDIRRKLDEIVAFAEIERFIDTPVKRYSSGMYVRLAFAVAAHLEPEILIVDEVLAVGDAAFQDKCLRKMGEAEKEGRTVLFVSHNIAAVNRLCHRGIVLEAGQLVLDASVLEATRAYLSSNQKTVAERFWEDPSAAPGDDVARLRAVRVISKGEIRDIVDIRFPVTVELEYWHLKAGEKLLPIVSFLNEQNAILFVSANFDDPPRENNPMLPGLYRARCTVPGNIFAEGQVHVASEVSTHYPAYEIHFLELSSVIFRVLDMGEPGSVRAGWARDIPGLVRPALDWHIDYLGAV